MQLGLSSVSPSSLRFKSIVWLFAASVDSSLPLPFDQTLLSFGESVPLRLPGQPIKLWSPFWKTWNLSISGFAFVSSSWVRAPNGADLEREYLTMVDEEDGWDAAAVVVLSIVGDIAVRESNRDGLNCEHDFRRKGARAKPWESTLHDQIEETVN